MIAELACQAITKKRVLELRYDGFSRSVEVHAVGISKKGNVVMACWQIGGGSVHNEPIGWKLMNVAEAASAVISSAPSNAPRDGYRKGDRRMIRIICEV